MFAARSPFVDLVLTPIYERCQRADPPVVTEVYDTRKDEVIVW